MKLHLTGIFVLSLMLAAPHPDVDAQERTMQIKGPKNATSQYSGVEFGPVDSSDTLWQIAERHRQNKNLSIYQVMAAIYQLNPNAFEQNNLNLIVDGAILRMPSERYISRIDPQKAQQRAEQDEREFARLQKQSGTRKENVKPAVPLVNQEDLSNTKTALEKQLTQMDVQQAKQFDELRQQFAASLENVQSLLDENRKLYERVDQVNTDLSSLRDQVEGDVQAQMDEQLALQRQLLDMIRQEQSERQAEKGGSLMDTLAHPVSLVVGSGILTLLIMGGLAAWLLKRREPPTDSAPDAPVSAASSMSSAPENTTVHMATAMPDNLADAAELSDDDLFNDDDLLDDVLSSELEEALDDELENFAELDEDDMLVPGGEDIFEDGEDSLDQNELDSLFGDGDTLNTEFDIDAIDLSESDDLLDEPNKGSDADISGSGAAEEVAAVAASSAKNDNTGSDEFVVEVSDEADANGKISAGTTALDATEETDDKPEISIDELLEEDKPATLEETLGVEDATINEDMLEKLDKEIHQQNQDLDRITDELIGEIEQIEMMGGMPDERDEDDDYEDEIEVSSAPSPQGIQDLDALTADLDEIDVEDMENADDFSDPLSDDLIAKLQSQSNEDVINTPPAHVIDTTEEGLYEHDLSNDLSVELLAELEAEEAKEDKELDELSDELLAELEAEEALSSSESQPEEKLPASDADNDESLTDATAGQESEDSDEEGSAQQQAEAPSSSSESQFDESPDASAAAPEADDKAGDHEENAETDPSTDAMVTPPQADQASAVDAGLADKDSGDINSDDPEEEQAPAFEAAPKTESEDSFDSSAGESEDLAAGADDFVATDPLDEALDAFDKQMMDEIPSFSEIGAGKTDTAFNDSILENSFDETEEFSLEQEIDGVLPNTQFSEKEINELEDVPGLDDWLTGDSDSSDDEIFDELENSDFDELLGSIDDDTERKPESQSNIKLDNPDLDLEALLTDTDAEPLAPRAKDEASFLDVETLLDESMQEDEDNFNEVPLDLDVSLSDFTGVSEDDDIIDIDKDAGQSANLDLARVYIEMDDMDAARELLKEVAEKGNSDLQEEAENLLASLKG
ncbi:AAA family ATPase [Alteromonas pelagimontana]|uniref:AAA family ATPase n=1 Tax=Alteromonas pelagimontana TaxID=1858656 RepID=A0A6M4MGI1_9ALTE|nr:FimV/HubP family polar landmark protein [Alteromonas pelagimontana]QJR82229.1 AAA family ATPase [Alteromonas pelagimontana]